jgi:hyperosmotically inducible periplasmic protein
MKRLGLYVAAPVLLMVTASVAPAQEGAKQATRDAAQSAQDTARKSGNAVKDGWITMKIHSQFVPEDALKDSDIDVDTARGVVTLNGTVASAAGKTRAVAIAKATDGVTSVTDNLRVAATPDMTSAAREAGRDAAGKAREAGRDTRDAAGTAGKAMTDGWIKSKIAAQYVTEDSLDNSDIDIDISRGAVVLKGAVRTAAARTRAEAIAKATDGVKGVTNNLKVDPAVK